MDLSFSIKAFDELTVHELYELLRLRAEVFVVEQDCVYQDLDNKDQQSIHVLMYKENKLVGCSRLVPPGLSYKEISIGRVITSEKVRGTGLGRELMKVSIQACHEKFGPKNIRLSAQVYAKAFYASLGFQEEGEPYDEDGIPHISMVYTT
ncbi:GNAT family N-acetyltransferase [Algoriphagus sediminis]|uniref:GNAT family N-acetyltransferase n=1 Tax=Algoriphagus sediminis TaxID=3057113 RepID=A0ABT7YDH8_9BACT|nr:GNAT family N-acetyltransferase [Algoriphagus sediminis]MDN3204590.1 GNAT family N-acetyltransferase [Algoriphagus sediminis]